MNTLYYEADTIVIFMYTSRHLLMIQLIREIELKVLFVLSSLVTKSFLKSLISTLGS